MKRHYQPPAQVGDMRTDTGEVWNGLDWVRADFPAHGPYRGSDVEKWLTAQRDRWGKKTPHWHALDRLLDDYAMRANTGRTLTEPLGGE